MPGSTVIDEGRSYSPGAILTSAGLDADAPALIAAVSAAASVEYGDPLEATTYTETGWSLVMEAALAAISVPWLARVVV
jgi:hypothetical protein